MGTGAFSPQNNPMPFGSLFRTLGDDDDSGQPVQPTSPFGSSASAPLSPLTVGDVLPQLPPELAKASAIPPHQPVQISAQTLRQALSSGQPAIPIFEIYRVCPGIFQVPVSPEDSRMVPLPASKLPAMLAAANGAPAAESAPVAAAMTVSPGPTPNGFANSPFQSLLNGPAMPSHQPSPSASLSTPPPLPASAPAASPTEPAAAPRSPVSLPPRRAPDQLPAQSIDSHPLDQGGFNGKLPTLGIPTASGAAAPESAVPSPAPESAAGGSPFAPAPAAAASSPFSMSFKNPGSQAPEATAPAAPPQLSDGPHSVQVAALVQGHSAEALGFEPAMVPSWITSTLRADTVRQISTSAQPTIDLGTVVDGITDVGFRQVLQTARRAHPLPLPLALLHPVSTAPTPSPLPTTPPPLPTPKRSVQPGNPFSTVPSTAPGAAVASPFSFLSEQQPTPPAAPPSNGVGPFATVPPARPAATSGSSSGPIQPRADAASLFGFGSAPKSPEPAAPEPIAPPAAAPTAAPAADPFAQPKQGSAPAPTEDDRGGFSSLDLLGKAAPPPPPEPAPTPLFPADDEDTAPPSALPELPPRVERTPPPAEPIPESEDIPRAKSTPLPPRRTWIAAPEIEVEAVAQPVSEQPPPILKTTPAP
ncbi:MAG: hypothetical protein KDK99_17730, partial [Verrucomicrobiales bacterium]|nr:hypothetical protein [Verrucomicrobiales bacterium]